MALVPADKAKVQAEVLASVEHQQFGRARTVLDQALRASPDEVDLHSASIALDALVQKTQRLNQASATQKALEADLVRQRRNADVTDHPNPLDERDNSGVNVLRRYGQKPIESKPNPSKLCVRLNRL